MKNIMLVLVSGAFFLSSCGPTRVVEAAPYAPAPEAAPVAAVSYQAFYDDLSPYGDWINDPVYGYVWMPNAGPDFMPYSTNGNWIYTDAGWTWASNYNWGWAPFHYGRWFYQSGYGWMWVPGNEWAPAWVSWRGGNDYYGWAPLGPGVSIDVALGSYNPPMNYWNFIPSRYMGDPQWHNYYVDRSRNVTIIHNTTIINNYSGTNRARYAYAPGPDLNEVRRVSGANIRPVQIRESRTPGTRISGDQLNIYRPRVDAAPARRADVSARPAPARVQPLREVRPQLQNGNDNNAARPAVRNPDNNNTRPSTQPALPNPGANARPSAPPPAAANPTNNNRPSPAAPAQNANGNNRPAAGTSPRPATTGRPVNSRFNQNPGNAQPAQPQRRVPEPSPSNRAQMHVTPAPQTARPQQAARPAPQPRQQTPQPVRPAPVRQAPVRQTPVRQAPARQTPTVRPDNATRQQIKRTEPPKTRTAN